MARRWVQNYSLHFDVLSRREDATDVTSRMLLRALNARIRQIKADGGDFVRELDDTRDQPIREGD